MPCIESSGSGNKYANLNEADFPQALAPQHRASSFHPTTPPAQRKRACLPCHAPAALDHPATSFHFCNPSLLLLSAPMVSSDHAKTVLLASVVPAALLALALGFQWHRTSCSFREAPPGSGLYTCTQRHGVQTELVRVQERRGWLWARRQVGARSAAARWVPVAAGLQNFTPLPSPPSSPPQVDHWVLVGAGAPNSLFFSPASSLVRAVKRRLRPARGGQPGQLDLIICEHSLPCGVNACIAVGWSCSPPLGSGHAPPAPALPLQPQPQRAVFAGRAGSWLPALAAVGRAPVARALHRLTQALEPLAGPCSDKHPHGWGAASLASGVPWRKGEEGVCVCSWGTQLCACARGCMRAVVQSSARIRPGGQCQFGQQHTCRRVLSHCPAPNLP